MGLVGHIVKKFADRAGKTYDYEDIFSIGSIGLIKAVDTFDSGKGFAFSTYASRCILNEILQAFRKKNEIMASLQDIVFDGLGNEITLADTIPDKEPHFTETVEDEIFLDGVKQIMNENLGGHEKAVFEMLYNYTDRKPTNNEVAAILGVSQPQVSRLDRKIRQKLSTLAIETGVVERVSVN